MNKNIIEHPNFLNANDIDQICRPLQKLNITYFAHVNIDNNGMFSSLANNPEHAQHYLVNDYFNADIHMSNSDLIKDFCVWDAIELDGESEKMNAESEEFGARHTFTIINKSEKGNDYYHFATDQVSKAINQVYLTNIDLLNLFIMHFNEKVRQSKELSNAYKLKFSLNKENTGFNAKIPNNEHSAREQFLNEFELSDRVISKSGIALTKREINILSWLHHGKTSSDIASILGIAEITVNKHIRNLKSKFKCYSQFQLGENFSSLFVNSEDVIGKICG